MAYDSAATRARLLQAGYDEFVQRGLAGARVDRIAAGAEANKQAIYAYFGSKELLFDAVLSSRLQVLADLVPFDPDDLPGYAGALFDHLVGDPGLLRLTQWKALEVPDSSAEEYAAHMGKAQELATARGVPAELAMDVLMLVIAAAQAWNNTAPAIRLAGAGHEGERLARHRAAVVRGVRAMAGELLPSTRTADA